MSRESSRKWYYSNKESRAAAMKAWRDTNKDYVREKQREDKRTRKLWAIKYLGEKCNECKNTFHPSIYEFHHVDPETKDKDPSKMMSLSLLRLTNELDKCILLCANCHRLIHHGDSY